MNKASLPFLSLGGWSQRPADVVEVAHSSTPRHRSQGENPPLGLTLGGQWTGEDGFRPCPRAQASRTWQGGGAGRGEGWFPFRLVFWLSSEARDCSGLLPQGHSSHARPHLCSHPLLHISRRCGCGSLLFSWEVHG